jgi:hypothetical protein
LTKQNLKLEKLIMFFYFLLPQIHILALLTMVLGCAHRIKSPLVPLLLSMRVIAKLAIPFLQHSLIKYTEMAQLKRHGAQHQMV